jgi:hypothetical protein
MADGGGFRVQQWLPGLEPGGAPTAVATAPRRDRRRAPKPPPVDKLAAQASPRVRKVFTALREAILGLNLLTEEVRYEDSSATFHPAYLLGDRELLRLHLDPVLAATVTLDRGDRQLLALLGSPRLDDEVKGRLLRCARKSGRRVFLALLVRNPDEAATLVAVLREHLGDG